MTVTKSYDFDGKLGAFRLKQFTFLLLFNRMELLLSLALLGQFVSEDSRLTK